MTNRRCVGCGKILDRKNLIKITVTASDKTVVINPDSLTFGRSAYLCYNESCIEAAFKKNRISKNLKTSVPSELKGQLTDELRNG